MTNIQKFPQLYKQQLPIPDRDVTIHAVYRSTLDPKAYSTIALASLIAFSVLVLSSIILIFLFIKTLINAFLMVVLALIWLIAVAMIYAKELRKKDELVDQIKKCYADYLNNPIHSVYRHEIYYYHACLKDWKSVNLEKRHFVAYNKVLCIEDCWQEHMQQLGPLSIPSAIFDSPRGGKLAQYGFYPFYELGGEPLSLCELYRKHLSFEETLSFWNSYQMLKASFNVDARSCVFAEALIKRQVGLAAEEAELLRETQTCLERFIEIAQDRKKAYLSFKERYLALTKGLKIDRSHMLS